MAQQHTIARESRQRGLVVLAGERHWACELLKDLDLVQSPLWVSDKAPDNVSSIERAKARQYLGREIDGVIYDAWAGFDPDALAAVSGALVGGGLFILLVPPLHQWPSYHDPDYQRLFVHPVQAEDISGRFIQHIIRHIRADKNALLIEQNQPITFIPVTPIVSAPLIPMADHCLTADQSQAVNAITNVLTGRSRRPLVIRSDRGRGKSSALGIASASLMQQRDCRIIITAPRLESVQAVFEHAARLLAVEPSPGCIDCIDYQQSRLQFIAPDKLIRNKPDADLLLVDEAAAIPAFILEHYLSRYNRIVFSTTVHGYEGSGRGFDIRFKQTLDNKTPQWQSCVLQQAIRWADNDPVENWLFDSLLLKVSAIDKDLFAACDPKQCVSELLNRDQLLDNSADLEQLFSLLVSAHYQTTPADLRNILDGPNISIWVSRYRGHIIAAALLADEGGFDKSLAESIWQGTRRPQGHLIAQSLSAHCGFKEAPLLRYQRVMRIAVNPLLQRQQIGKQLLAEIVLEARQQGVDCIGSSFAATADVLQFWRSVQCIPVRLGTARDASSGCYSAMVLSALSVAGESLLTKASQRFGEYLPRDLSVHYPQLEPALAIALLLDINTQSIYLDQQAWLDIEAFVLGHRQYQTCHLALWKLAVLALSNKALVAILSQEQQQLLVLRVMQQLPISEVVEQTELSGKKALQEALREIIQTLFLQRQTLAQ
ncbi:hypothetical protein BST96_13690 [Oceanicoccus sagamiensis]|uniref:tRNA(Met) cytidine acetyltransferase TmcA n=1 Tax=Oceanicoccus sagamiensis TaxID=716816 RepID=A0A1X9NNU8_9GAMM|nr:hypothetical protein BST96_13690 [Oceanicoccus sagamiensis]